MTGDYKIGYLWRHQKRDASLMDSVITPRVAILLPVYNGESYLENCLRSVLDQSYSNFELLVGNDASTDHSLQILEKYRDERIRLFRHRENLGLFRNLNFLLGQTMAPLIRLLGQDDILEPGCLAEESRFFQGHSSIGMSFCKARYIGADGNERDRSALGDLPEIIGSLQSVQYFYYYGCLPGSISTVMIRGECLDPIGRFDESFRVAADYDLWTRICQSRDMGVIHQHLVRVRVHQAQLSSANPSRVAFVSENRRVRTRLLPFLPAQDRSWARLYPRMRQQVFDAHYAVQFLFAGKFGQVLQIIRTMGLGEFGISLMFWLLTANNRLFKPPARIRLMGK